MNKESSVYGYLARYNTPEALIDAARRVYAAGYRRFDTYTPFPVEGLAEVMRLRSSPLPFFILAGGVAGAVGGFLMQYYATAIDYPMNIGGRPLNSWPTYIPIAFELTILLAAVAGVLGLFLFTQLPQPYHPVFNVEDFQQHGARDGFFLSIEARDPKFDPSETRKLLEDSGSAPVSEIEV